MKKENILRCICIAAFMIFAFGAAAFLHLFTNGIDSLRFLEWDSAVIVDIDGAEKNVPLSTLANGEIPETKDSEYWIFSGSLKNITDRDELTFELMAQETEIMLDGAVIFSETRPADGIEMTQVNIPLVPENSGQTISMKYVPGSFPNYIFPPLIRIENPPAQSVSEYASGNFYSIPATLFAVIFVLLWGLFLLGILSHKTDWSLLLLILSCAVLSVHDITIGLGYYFHIDDRIIAFLARPLWTFLPVVLLLAYMILNKHRIFRRQFAITALLSILAFIGSCIVSFVQNGYFFNFVKTMMQDLILYGAYNLPLYWLTGWLVILCAVLSSINMVHTFVHMQAESQTLAQKNTLIMESYHAMAQGITATNALRHEMKNHLTALQIMYQQGDLEKIGNYLDSLEVQQQKLAQLRFTENFTINTILQNIACRCSQNRISLRADIIAPKELSIPEGDLCSLLINLLDNALEAAAKTPAEKEPYILIRMNLKQEYLTIYCENTYNGILRYGEKHELLSTKQDSSSHGFGIKQMNSIVHRYHSILDISSTDDKFIVQTALRLPS